MSTDLRGSSHASTEAARALDALSAHDISRIRIETPDLNGALRGKYVAVEKLATGKPLAFPEVYLALAVDDEVIEGVPLSDAATGFPDVLVAPDWDTLRAVPGEEGVAAVVGDGVQRDGSRHPLHPRSVLRSVVDRVGADGYEGVVGVEYAFWAFRCDEASDLARRAGDVAGMTPLSFTGQGYSLLRWGDHAEFAADLDRTTRAFGLPIETLMTEIGNGMLEVALAPAPALEAADMAARFKVIVRDVARRHGLFVTFMAKLLPGEQGSSGHLHQSLLHHGRNAFWGGSEGTLSDAGRHYAAGLMRATRECASFFAPFPNSYRRYVPDMWAPLQLTWGWDDRTSSVRAITLSEASSRFEQRRAGADLQPYLAIAACLAGGVDGILRGADPGPPGTPVANSDLPTDLVTAAGLLRESEFARDWLGDGIVDLYVASREAEHRSWQQLFKANIPAWEVRRYFEVV
jgi:glutamine synthetase